jgi:hypothetical protein
MNNIITIILLGISCAAISYTVTKSLFFDSFRLWFFNRTVRCIKIGSKLSFKLYEFIYNLISCPYCFSHWVALGMNILWVKRITTCQFPTLDFIVSWMVIVGISAIVNRIIDKE